jgi:hypothetical protein
VDEVGPDVDDLVAGDEVFGLAPLDREGAVTGDTGCGVGVWNDPAPGSAAAACSTPGPSRAPSAAAATTGAPL